MASLRRYAGEHAIPDTGDLCAAPLEPQLGLVCITTGDDVRYNTVTRTRLLKLSLEDQKSALRRLYDANLATLDGAATFCQSRNIRLYRATSALFPFADTPEGMALLETMADRLAQVGRRFTSQGIRMVLHPDQFVVLSSDSEEVAANSRMILETHARIFDLLEQPRSPWAAFNVHGGKGGRTGVLIERIRALPESVRGRLTLENDEYAYSAGEILEVCRQAGVPMVFDAHHHVVKEGLDSYDHPSVEAMLDAARETWHPHEEWQMVHISNGRAAFQDRQHSDLITVMPKSFRKAPWIEVEAKLKEQAIEGIRSSGW